jgi:hypothetical protein
MVSETSPGRGASFPGGVSRSRQRFARCRDWQILSHARVRRWSAAASRTIVATRVTVCLAIPPVEDCVRAFGLLLIAIGLVAFALPAYPFMLVRLHLAPDDIRGLGGVLFVLGGVTLWFTRRAA